RLHEGGLAATGRTGYHDVLAVHHRTPEELGVLARMAQLQQLTILLADAAIGFQDLIEEAVFVILASIAYPSFRGMIRSNRLATANNELIALAN
ncbi:hypothetical protein, partial [Mycobacterium tuberculosis]|uniref:hypothetical protein n=1 Tax=Mycobacterium tuberculosis TaxID=1773 RepID=UPI001F3833B1